MARQPRVGLSSLLPAESPPRRLRADALRNRQRILDAAEGIFANRGVEAPIDDIAALAGVGIGTVYRHFPTKEVLFQAIVTDRFDRLAEQAAALERIGDPEALFLYVATMASFVASHRGMAEEISRQGGLDAQHASFKAGLKLKLTGCIRRLLGDAQASGAVRADVTAEDITALVAGLCYATRENTVASERLVAIVCEGLREHAGTRGDLQAQAVDVPEEL